MVMALAGVAFIGTAYLLYTEKTSAEESAHIGISLPLPAVVISEPPTVVLISGTPVYYAPDVGIDLFFYSGCWYRKHNDHWYRATYYNGPWICLPAHRVPAVFVRLPADYCNVPPGHQRITYDKLKKQWKKLEKEHFGKGNFNKKITQQHKEEVNP